MGRTAGGGTPRPTGARTLQSAVGRLRNRDLTPNAAVERARGNIRARRRRQAARVAR